DAKINRAARQSRAGLYGGNSPYRGGHLRSSFAEVGSDETQSNWAVWAHKQAEYARFSVSLAVNISGVSRAQYHATASGGESAARKRYGNNGIAGEMLGEKIPPNFFIFLC